MNSSRWITPSPCWTAVRCVEAAVITSRIEIIVAGIDEPALADEVETAIRDALLRMMLPGAWRVAVSPSPVSGRWDLSISGPGRRHVMAITVPSRLLPSLIPSRLEESLNHAAQCVAERTADEQCQSQTVDRRGRGSRSVDVAPAV